MVVLNNIDFILCNYILLLSKNDGLSPDLDLARAKLSTITGDSESSFGLVLDSLIGSALQKISKETMTIEKAEEFIMVEYDALGFNTTFFEYTFITPLIDDILRHSGLEVNPDIKGIDLCNRLHEHIKMIPMESLRYGLYTIVLRLIVEHRLIYSMIDTVNDITEAINTYSGETCVSLSLMNIHF